MSDLTKRNYSGSTSRLQADTERATAGLRKDLEANTSFDPSADDWAGTPPTTWQEAVARLAYHIRTGAGNNPIVELP